MDRIPCLVTRDLHAELARQDRWEAAYDAAEAEINAEAYRIDSFLRKHPTRGPAGWQDMEPAELLAAVGDDDLLWRDIVSEAM